MRKIILMGLITTFLNADYIVDKTDLEKEYQQQQIELQQKQIKQLQEEKKELKRLYSQCKNYKSVLKKEPIIVLLVSNE